MKVDLDLGYTQVLIIKARAAGLLRNELAYLLATVYHETAHTMKPVVEAYWLSEAWRKRNLRYYPWHGRGFVQLTWEENYERAARELNIPALATDPTLALDPGISAEIAIKGMKEGWFTRHRFKDHITLQKSDFFNARSIINPDKNKKDKSTGLLMGDLIAGYAKEYDKKLKEVGYGEETPFKVPTEVVQTIPDDPGVIHPVDRQSSVEHSPGFSEPALNFIEVILQLITTIFRGKK